LKYLLDTAVWLWSVGEPERLSSKAVAAILDLKNEIFLSAASSWEITIKHASGKLSLPEHPSTYIPRRMAQQRLSPLPISHQHALFVSTLAPHHRDPFDRLLIAQAKVEDLIVITTDSMFEKYPAEILWAGE
jgi:PIN domain nuclease of toxin-antitoxin system